MSELLAITLITLFFTFLLISIYEGNRDKREGFFLFVIILLPLWVFSSWIKPVGPLYYGVAWFDIFLIGLFLFFFIMSLYSPYHFPSHRRLREPQDKALLGTGFFFWFFCLFAILAALFKSAY